MRAIDADAFKDYIRGACEDMKHLFKDNADFAKLITESFCKELLITKEENDKLLEISKRTGVSRTRIIRESLIDYLKLEGSEE